MCLVFSIPKTLGNWIASYQKLCAEGGVYQNNNYALKRFVASMLLSFDYLVSFDDTDAQVNKVWISPCWVNWKYAYIMLLYSWSCFGLFCCRAYSNWKCLLITWYTSYSGKNWCSVRWASWFALVCNTVVVMSLIFDFLILIFLFEFSVWQRSCRCREAV